MTRRFTAAWLLAASLLAGAAHAKDPLTVGLSTGYTGAYMLRGFKLGDSGQASTLSASYQVGPRLSVTGSIWNYQAYEQKQGNATNFDAHLAWSPAKVPAAFGLGWIYYGGTIGGSIKEIYGTVTATELPGNPTLAVYKGYTRPSHTVLVGSAGHAWQFGRDWTYTAWGAVGANFGKSYAPDGFAVAILGNTLSHPLTKGLSVNATLDFHAPSGRYNNSLRLVPGINLAYSSSF